MDRKRLRTLIEDYWDFGYRLIYEHQGNITDAINSMPDEWWPCAQEIALGLHRHHIDPSPFWHFHHLVWHDDLLGFRGGAASSELLEKIRTDWSRALLPFILFLDLESSELAESEFPEVVRIPPEFRSKPLSKKEIATIHMGCLCTNPAQYLKRKRITVQGSRNAKLWIVDVRQFPTAIHHKLLPEKN
ncbi:MAG: hypothetical protein KDA57_17425 [Planctomycetales bacterium]|nr:hypothetical protein [Planctomycetales bacterium]